MEYRMIPTEELINMIERILEELRVRVLELEECIYV
jgi:hypothetical protein